MKKSIKIYGKRILSAILCLITLITTLPINQVLAWTSSSGQQCSSIVGENYVSIDGGNYYFTKEVKAIIYDEHGNISLKSFNRARPLEKFYLNYNGETVVAFCIEGGTSFKDSTNGYISENYNNSSFFNNLPYAARYGIMATSIYGWRNDLPSELQGICNMDDFRYAVQLIMWEYQQQIRTSPTELSSKNGVPYDMYYHSIQGRPAEQAYNWLLRQIANHSTIPSFTSRSELEASLYTMKYNPSANNYSITLTDNNNTFADLKFNTNSGINISRNGNQYTFTTSNMITNAVTISAQKSINQYNDAFLIWGRGGYQTMATGCEDPVYFYLKLNTETYGSARIIKESEDGIVKGINFRIVGNGIDKIVTTLEDGTITVDNLMPGIYEVTEQVDDKYEPQNTQRVTVISGQQSTVTFSNTLKRGNLKVTKTSEDYFVEGIKFHLYGQSKSGTQVNEYAVTNSEGIAEFNDVLISGDKGYTLEEVDTNIKYVVPASQQVIIKWNEVTKATVNNKLKKFNVTVTKSDIETGIAQGDATLEGAVYGIYNNNQLVDKYTTDKNRTIYDRVLHLW